MMRLFTRLSFALLFCCAYCTLSYGQAQWTVLGPKTSDATPMPAGITSDSVVHLSFAVAPQGIPYMAFVNPSNGNKVSVMSYNAATGWTLVGAAGFSAGKAGSTSITIAPNGTPYVYYINKEEASLDKGVVMKFNGTAWETVGNQATLQWGTITFPVIITDAAGVPYIAHRQTSFLEVSRYPAAVRRFNAATSSWDSLGVFASGNSNSKPGEHNIYFNNEGKLYWTGKDFSRSSTRVWDGEGTYGWTRVGASNTTPGSNGARGTIHDGIPYHLFTENASANKDNLTLYKFTGIGTIAGGWEQIGPKNFTGLSASNFNVIVNNNGIPFVAYEEGDSTAVLKMYNSTTDSWDYVATPWGDDPSRGVAEYTTLVKGPQGDIYMAFSDMALNGKAVVLKYGTAEPLSAAKDLGKKDGVQVYPNPSTDAFYFVAGSSFIYTIYNQAGQVIEQGQGNGNGQVGVNLKSGLYLMKLQTKGRSQTMKLLKQ